MNKEEIEKLLAEAMAKLPPPAEPIKPGFLTTEFITVVSMLLTTLFHSKLGLDVSDGTISNGLLLAAGYLVSRFGLKLAKIFKA